MRGFVFHSIPYRVVVVAITCLWFVSHPLVLAAPSVGSESHQARSIRQVPANMRWEPNWRRPSDCGPACLFLMARILGHSVAMEEVTSITRVDPELGCTLDELFRASKRLRLPTEMRFVAPREIRKVVRPLILHSTGSLATGRGHFRVVVDYDNEKQWYAIADTDADELKWIPEDSLLFGYSGYVLVPVGKSSRSTIVAILSSVACISLCLLLFPISPSWVAASMRKRIPEASQVR